MFAIMRETRFRETAVRVIDPGGRNSMTSLNAPRFSGKAPRPVVSQD